MTKANEELKSILKAVILELRQAWLWGDGFDWSAYETRLRKLQERLEELK